LPSTPSSGLPEPPWRASRWKSFVVGLVAAFVVAAIVAWALAVRDDGDASPRPPGRVASPDVAEAGDPAPDFALPTLDGEQVRLSDLRGRPVVVNFWASWCNPCREEFPLLAGALDEHETAELAVVGVTYRDIESDSRAFVDEFGASWPQAVDEDTEVARAYGVRAIPQTFFIDRDGTIAARVFGFSSERALEEPLATILDR
jgi:cytochrome c biogenesis protein CcmG/thiol:disulfide interchange protein DsbE